MRTQDVMDDDRLVSALVDELEHRAGRPPVAAHVVAGSRRRMKRRRRVRTAVALGGVAAAVAVGAATIDTAGLLGSSPDAVRPMGPGGDDPAGTSSAPRTSASTTSASAYAGCSLTPSSCDGEVVGRWLKANLAGITSARGASFEPAATASKLDRSPEGTVYLSSAAISGPMGDGPQSQYVFPDKVDIYVTRKGSGTYHWERPAMGQPDGSFEERLVEVRPDVTARVLRQETGDGAVEMWSVPEGRGHGAVFLEVTHVGAPEEGRLTEPRAVELVELLLEGGPVGDGSSR